MIFKFKSEVGYGKDLKGKQITSQWEFLLNWFRKNEGKKISAFDAWNKWGFTKLATIVSEIRRHTGIVIPRETRTVVTRFGTRTMITVYYYDKEIETASNGR